MTNAVTHFEIYGENPVALADFYRKAFGWQIEQMEGIGYWRIRTDAAKGPALHGGLTYRAIPDLNGWLLFVNVLSLDESQRFARAQNFLWTVRCHLHWLAGRAEDRLTFDFQGEIGRRMGRKNVRTDDPVERLDVKILEVVMQLDQPDGLVPGIRVTGYIEGAAP